MASDPLKKPIAYWIPVNEDGYMFKVGMYIVEYEDTITEIVGDDIFLENGGKESFLKHDKPWLKRVSEKELLLYRLCRDQHAHTN